MRPQPSPRRCRRHPFLRRALLLFALLPGCLYVGGSGSFGAPIDADVASRIVPGHSTKAELLALLGPPDEYKRPEIGSVLLDDELRVSGVLASARRAENVFTWQHDSVEASGTVLLLYNGFWSEAHPELLVVWFDANDVVSAVGYRPRKEAP